MKNDDAVFFSNITKSGSLINNNLYDLLNVVPAKPLPPATQNKNETTFHFIPNSNKRYIPKKISKLKVRTVRDIRTLYEENVNKDLPGELEKQQNGLMKKIRYGFSTNEHTKNTGKSMLNGDRPISASAWQILTNMNPYNRKYPKQFVLWNGKCIQVNGSKGGKSKFLCNHDLKSKNTHIIKKTWNINGIHKRKLGLLRNSLNIKFKPGPLQKKKLLDDSHHKYHMGKVELIPLPKPALDILPSYGTAIEPTIAGVINSLRGEYGIISPKYAEFAVSVLGTISNNVPTQVDDKCCVTIELNYKYDQNRLLMRRNAVGSTSSAISQTNYCYNKNTDSLIRIIPEIQEVVERMIDTVEISLMQDGLYSLDDPRDTKVDEKEDVFLNVKDKPKKKINELSRLDVTVIKLPQMSQKVDTEPCKKSFCMLGCICDSLSCSFKLKQHCGVLECMFGCKCDLSVYKDMELFDRDNPEMLPGLLKLDNELNSHLAKEEQKFHQTVIVTDEQSILLKSRKRKCKSAPKYAEYYNNSCLQSKESTKQILKVVAVKLNCNNVEPFCMVHNLYKCFCKGNFSESSFKVANETNVTKTENGDTILENNIKTNKNVDSDTKISLRPRLSQDDNKRSLRSLLCREDSITNVSCLNNDKSIGTCARSRAYYGRKYSVNYYQNTNKKIKEMEENDELLKIRMNLLVNKAEKNYVTSIQQNVQNDSESDNETLYYDEVSNDSSLKSKSEENTGIFNNSTSKYNLKAWLESSFRVYKERLAKGLAVNSLSKPKKGLSSLVPWELILSRYRERKNIYVVSKEPPYRTFLVINLEHPIFRSCINIDDIRFADMSKYPVFVQNLITNTTETNNSFCMLRGWDDCWELIGTVNILENNHISQCSNEPQTESTVVRNQSLVSDDWFTGDTMPEEIQQKRTVSQESSKWFVMKVEKDFHKINFYNAGFFGTYERIQESTRLARLLGKTVRLLPKDRSEKNNKPAYGVYAIPSTDENCVFVGPYEENEKLGIEIIKTVLDTKKQEKTRGVWITTNKIDDMRVIDNPLSFMPSEPMINEDITQGNTVDGNDITEQLLEITDKVAPETLKVIKPIKISRTNIIRKVSSRNTILSTKNAIKINDPISLINKDSYLKQLLGKDGSIASLPVAHNVKPFSETPMQENTATNILWNENSSPVDDIAPQIKITSVYSVKTLQTKAQASNNIKTRNSSRMLILRPDEINKRVLLAENSIDHQNNANIDSGEMEGILMESPISTCPEDVLVISDCDDDCDSVCKPIWIECINVTGFGHFLGGKKENKFRFRFPGFKNSQYYTESQAFDKINQILARKIYVPKNVILKWKVLEKSTDVSSHLVTARDLRFKNYLYSKLEAMNREISIADLPFTLELDELQPSSSTPEISDLTNKTITLIDELEEASLELDTKTQVLLNEVVNKQSEIRNSLPLLDNLQSGMITELQDIFDSNNK